MQSSIHVKRVQTRGMRRVNAKWRANEQYEEARVLSNESCGQMKGLLGGSFRGLTKR